MMATDLAALEPLLATGYFVVSEAVDRRHFGDHVIVLQKQDTQLRMIREKGEWFADVGFGADPPEHFDMSIVMRAVGGEHPVPFDTRLSLATCATFVAANASRWEPLFTHERYDSTRQELRSLEIASAKERFGYIAE
jgi:hypothetical protein